MGHAIIDARKISLGKRYESWRIGGKEIIVGTMCPQACHAGERLWPFVRRIPSKTENNTSAVSLFPDLELALFIFYERGMNCNALPVTIGTWSRTQTKRVNL